MRTTYLVAGTISLALSASLAGAAPAERPAGSPPFAAEAVEFFETRVRPVLSESCVRCHGASKQASGLRLDSREAILEGGANGPAIVPGDPDKSLLVQAVRYSHAEIKMPPKAKLADPPIDALAHWVKLGAPWSTKPIVAAGVQEKAAGAHWAFQPVRDVNPPAVRNQAWVASPIDAFVLARLEAAGMSPSPQADKRTLIRRASFDLTGLPPTAEEIDAFEADTSSEAFARVVDRLLASPRYGERWGRHWLDVARYADTKGYVFTEERRYPYSYTYRDYVIRAFNEDLPYDRFVIEQLAADRLPPAADNRALAALGFLTVGRRFLNDPNEIIDDRIDVVSRGLLGLTVACARCHDHKYDPIPAEDYYSLYGVFASTVEPADLPVIQGSVPTAAAQDYAKQLAAREAEVQTFLGGKLRAINDDLRSRVGVYLRAAYDLEFNPRHPKLADRARADKVVRGRLRWMTERWKNHLAATAANNDPFFAPWHRFAAIPPAEFARKAPDVARALLSTKDPKRPIHPIIGKSFAEKPPAAMKDVVARYAALLDEAQEQWKAQLRFGPARALDDPEWELIRGVIQTPGGPVTLAVDFAAGPFLQFSEEMNRLFDLQDRQRLTVLTNQLVELKATHPGAPVRAMAVNDAARPVEPHVFLRGNPGRPGKAVPRRFLKLLAGPDRRPFANGSGRLELAQAIASPTNPLTARVLVNRVWLNHFGAGLVNTPSDFGLRSDPPTHPELLDWLAAEFLRSGWSIKTLHRRIMLSNTYQQRSDNNTAYLEHDPQNRLLWKFNRRRLDFEAMRDAILAVSGRLDPTMGGRPIAINDPPFVPRRTVYGFVDRQNLDDVFRTFDFASPDASSPRRYVTTVPQQALFLMNSPFVIEQAQHAASALEGVSADPATRIRALYRQLYARDPEPRELALGERFLKMEEDRIVPWTAWSYGHGEVEPKTQRAVIFTPFAPTNPGGTMPGARGASEGLVSLTAAGGHPGRDLRHAAIRRWTAPRDAVIAIDGTLAHGATEGDGVRGRIVARRAGILGEWVVHHGQSDTRVARYEAKRGETIDFVTDCRQNDSFDTFTWAPTIRMLTAGTGVWNASADFTRERLKPLSPWEEYAQVLMLTNEFMFVD
jgi:hypothetical protein